MKLGRAILLSAGTVLLAVGLPLGVMSAREPRTRAVDSGNAVKTHTQTSGDTLRLFPDVKRADVVTLAVTSPERSFSFEREADEVSVNGREADSNAFNMLLKKVVALPVSSREAFTAADTPILVITLSTANAQYTATFYDDGGDGARALICCGTQDALHYRETDGWRVGTLLMACDGTRIFDEQGRETLAD